MEAITYIRFSRLEQQQGGSLERQQRSVAAAINRHDWQHLSEYFDKGRSAFKNAHRERSAALQRLEEEVQQGQHAGRILVVEKLDRLSRLHPLETIDLVRSFLIGGVSILTADNDTLYEAYKPLPTSQIYPLIAEADGGFQFSKNLQDRVTRGWEISREKARAQGTLLTRKVPLWLSVNDERQIDVIASRAALVREWFQMADGGMGARAIVREMERRGEPTWGKSSVWNRSYISKTLSNRAVLGEFQPTTLIDNKRVADGEPWQDYYPAIVDTALFDRVVAEARARKSSGVARKEGRVPNLFAGLLNCQQCGGKFNYQLVGREGSLVADHRRSTHYRRKRDEGRLQCRNARISGGRKCTNTRSWGYLTFEDKLLEGLLPLALDDQSFANRGEVARLQSEIAGLERSLELKSAKATRLYDKWATDGSDILFELAKRIEREMTELEEKRRHLEGELASASGRVSASEHLARVSDVASRLYDDDRIARTAMRRKVSTVLHQLIDHIEFTSTNLKVYLHGNAAVLIFDRDFKALGFDLLKAGVKYPGLEQYQRRLSRLRKSGQAGPLST